MRDGRDGIMNLVHGLSACAMRIKPFFFYAILFLLLSFLPQLEAGEEPLIFAGDQSYAPIESLQDGRPEGLNIDVLQALSKAMGRTISIQLMQWNEAQEKVLKGEADALTIMSPSEERRTLYDFSDTTLTLHHSIFIKSDTMTIHKVKDLEGKRVGVTRGGFPRKILERNSRIQLVFIEDYREGYKFLISGTIDAVGADTWVGAYTIQKHGIRGVKTAGEPFSIRPSSIAVKKGNVKLLHDINAGIKKLRNDGTIEQIIDKWSSKEVVFLTREKIKTGLLVAMIVLFLAIAGTIIIWNKTLRDHVRDNTASLRSSEEKYRSLVESTEDAIYLVDKDYRYLFVNEKYLSRFGLLRDEITGREYGEFHPEEETADFSGKVKAVLETGESLSYEYRSKRDERYFIRTLSPVKGAEGRPAMATVVSKEITDRKRVEEKLRESEEFSSSLLNNAPNPIAVINQDTSIRYSNPAFETITGLSAEELTGVKAPYPWWTKETLKKTRSDLEEAMDRGITHREELFQKKNGERFWVEITSSPIRKNGEFQYYLANWVDVTERRQSEAALRQSEAQKQALLDASIDRIRLVDTDMRIIWANKTTARELNISPEDMEGTCCYKVFVGRDTPCPGCPTVKALESGRIEHSVMHHVSSKGLEGETYWDSYAVPVNNEASDILHVIQMSRNITDANKKEQQITQSLKEKELLLREIHHRVKNNMQVIASLLKLQAATIEDERLHAPFQDAEHRVRAMSLVDEKLYQSTDFTRVPFRDYLTSLIRYLSQSYKPQASNIKLIANIEEIPLDITYAIPCGLITNELLTNAFKHAFPEGRTGTINISLRSPEPGIYELTVKDDGIGLPEHIDIRTTQSLGLHLVSILAEDQLRGSIKMTRGEGTAFRIVFAATG
jgi:PAS domain S-box-containing protein